MQRTRREPEPWRLAAVWVMLPGLRAAAHRLAQRTRLDIAEIRSAFIAGFLEALGTIDPQRENLGSALYWSSYTSARATCRAYGRELPTEDIDRAGKLHDVPDVPVHALPVTVDLATAARALGISMTTAYRLTRRNAFPCTIMRPTFRYRVPTASLMTALDIDLQPVHADDVEHGIDFARRFA